MSSTARRAVISHFRGINYPTLAQWQAVTGQDLHSRDIDPTESASPFPRQMAQPGPAGQRSPFRRLPGNSYAGTNIPEVAVDIDGESRAASAPYMGADELAVPAALPDADGDGAADSIERMAGNIDGNGDGTPDYLQANVAAVPSAVTGNAVIVESAPGTCCETSRHAPTLLPPRCPPTHSSLSGSSRSP